MVEMSTEVATLTALIIYYIIHHANYCHSSLTPSGNSALYKMTQKVNSRFKLFYC